VEDDKDDKEKLEESVSAGSVRLASARVHMAAKKKKRKPKQQKMRMRMKMKKTVWEIQSSIRRRRHYLWAKKYKCVGKSAHTSRSFLGGRTLTQIIKGSLIFPHPTTRHLSRQTLHRCTVACLTLFRLILAAFLSISFTMIYSFHSLLFLFLFSGLVWSAASALTPPGPYYGPVSLFGACAGARRAVVNSNTGDVYGTCFDSSQVLMWPGGNFAVQPVVMADSTLCPLPQSAVLSAQGDLYVECWNGGGVNDFVLAFPQAQPASVVTPYKVPTCGGGLAVSSNNTLYATCYGNLVARRSGGRWPATSLQGNCGTNDIAISHVNGDVAAACSQQKNNTTIEVCQRQSAFHSFSLCCAVLLFQTTAR
jgi:hypothetical protein